MPHAGLTREVDEYDGSLAGMVLAEVELECESQAVEMPPWLGQEVTGDSCFRQSTMLASRIQDMIEA